MNENEKILMRAVRVEVATKICLGNPAAFEKASALNEGAVEYKDQNEKLAVGILREFFRLEPSIKHILSFYLKKSHISVPMGVGE